MAGAQYHVGVFDTQEDAASAVRAFREKLHGEFYNHGEGKCAVQ
jgi:hypothetical protein